METLTIVFFKTGAVIGVTVMLISVYCVADHYIRLWLTARGSVEQIERWEDALFGAGLIGGGFVISAFVHFISTETISVWLIRAFVDLSGVCFAVALIVRSGFIL